MFLMLFWCCVDSCWWYLGFGFVGVWFVLLVVCGCWCLWCGWLCWELVCLLWWMDCYYGCFLGLVVRIWCLSMFWICFRRGVYWCWVGWRCVGDVGIYVCFCWWLFCCYWGWIVLRIGFSCVWVCGLWFYWLVWRWSWVFRWWLCGIVGLGLVSVVVFLVYIWWWFEVVCR